MKPMLLEDILYTQGFGTRRVCAGLLEKGLVQVYVDENTSENDGKICCSRRIYCL